jgi:hypothetical protein
MISSFSVSAVDKYTDFSRLPACTAILVESHMPHMKSIASLGHALATSSDCFQWIQPGIDLLNDPVALRHRLDQDGYLYLPGLLDTGQVDAARQVCLSQLNDAGLIDRSQAVEAGVARQPWSSQSCHHLVKDNQPLLSVLYSGKMIEFYQALLEFSVRHFDFTWLRAIGPGNGTAPHCDAVYMGRGTRQLYTSWTPLMEITPDIGGLTIMPGSHRVMSLDAYRHGDVDIACTNRPQGEPLDVHGWVGPAGDGKLSSNPVELQQELGLPWVTAECYRPGDVVIFSIGTIHGSLDNQSDRVRLSTDSRYQRADEPADERWIGADPIGHGPESRRDVIC